MPHLKSTVHVFFNSLKYCRNNTNLINLNFNRLWQAAKIITCDGPNIYIVDPTVYVVM